MVISDYQYMYVDIVVQQKHIRNDNRFMYVHTVDNGLLTIDHRVSTITDFVQINEAVVTRSLDYIEPSITS